MKHIGVCLSGGGIRSVAHLGALKALEESGYKIDEVIGVSGGSIVTLLYTYGYTVDQMIKLSYYLNWLTLPFLEIILQHLTKDRKQIIPGFVTYTLMNGRMILDFPRANTVARSCNIPGIPAISGKYMDGCISNNYPVDLLGTENKICFNVVNKVHPGRTYNYFKQLSYVNDMYVLQKCPDDAVDLITEYVDPLKSGKKVYDRLIKMGYRNTKRYLDGL